MPQHRDIVDPEIHEPKGVASAAANTAYLADGAGSGAWDKVPADALDDATVWPYIETAIDDGDIQIAKTFVLSAVIPDISTPDFILVPIPDSCTFIGAHLVLKGPITVDDATVSFVNAGAATLGTDVVVEFDGSAEGDQYEFVCEANEELTGPTYIKISTDGNSTDAQPLYITLVFEQPVV